MMNSSNSIHCSYINAESDDGPIKIHSITAGPPRTPPKPAVIFICGLGSSAIGFATVMRQLASKGITSYTYDRPGLGRSPGTTNSSTADPDGNDKPAERSAQQMAKGVAAYIAAAKIAAPYILVLHSYGGVIGREYLQEHLDDVVGLVFIDANCQNAADRGGFVKEYETILRTKGVSYPEDTGLNAVHTLESNEWAEIFAEGPLPEGFERGTGGEMPEMKGYDASCRALKRLPQYDKHIMGRKPVSVVKGNVEQELGKVAAKAELNPAVDREALAICQRSLVGMSERESKLQRDQLLLAEDGYGRFVDVKDAGHHVHWSHPDIVTNEIAWVVEQVHARGIGKEWEQRQANV